MKKRILRHCTTLVLGLAATQAIVSAEEAPAIAGTWDVSVTIRQCETGSLIRAVRAMNLFIHDGSLTETAANFLRTPSVGTWRHLNGHTYTATLRFFRYNPDGTFASTAKVTRTIELSQDGDQFTSTGSVEDFNAAGVRISVGCATETATHLR
jgi:hypothetical protein